MRYKSDWEMSKKRFEAFWNGEIVDRCCFSVKAFDQKRFNPIRLVPGSNEDRFLHWTDPERIIKRNRLLMENTYYGGEAFPCIFLDLGAGGHAGFFKGAKYQFGDSMWFFPITDDPESIEFDENSFPFKKTLELAQAFAEDSKGDYFISMPDSTGNADALTHLMGTEELMPQMLEEPEAIKAALNKMEYAYERVMREVYDIVKDVNEGGSCVDWMSTWAPGFHAQMQSDMSVMISNPMFKEFVLPEIQTQSKFLQYPIYHFDGIEQRRHLDDLLSIPELKAIQWTQVAGQPPCTDFLDDLKKIQAAGKNLLLIIGADQIPEVMENLSSKGLFIVTYASQQEEADALIRQVSKLTHD